MNRVVEAYRRLDPDGRSRTMTDDQITLELGDRLRGQGDYGLETAYPDFKADYMELRRLVAPSLTRQTIDAGMAGLLDRAPAIGYALGGMASEALGAEGAQNWFLDQVRRNNEEAADRTEGRAITRVEDIEGPSDFFQWALPVFAENAPQLVASVGAGVAGAAVTANPLVGAAVGAGAMSIAQNVGDQYSKLALDAETREKALETALVGGTAAGLIDAVAALIPAGKIASMFKGLDKVRVGKLATGVMGRGGWTGGAQGFLSGAAGEGTTEALQEAIAIAGEEYASGKQKTPEEIRSRLLNAGLAGGVVGAPIGAVVGALPSDSAPSTAATIPPIEHPGSPQPGIPTPGLNQPTRPIVPVDDAPAVDPDGALVRQPTNVAAPATEGALVQRAETQPQAAALVQPTPPLAVQPQPQPTQPNTQEPNAQADALHIQQGVVPVAAPEVQNEAGTPRQEAPAQVAIPALVTQLETVPVKNITREVFSTDEAHLLGLRARTKEDTDALKAAYLASSMRVQDLAQEGSPDEMWEIFRAAFYREAYEAATGTESAGDQLRAEMPGYVPPVPGEPLKQLDPIAAALRKKPAPAPSEPTGGDISTDADPDAIDAALEAKEKAKANAETAAVVGLPDVTSVDHKTLPDGLSDAAGTRASEKGLVLVALEKDGRVELRNIYAVKGVMRVEETKELLPDAKMKGTGRRLADLQSAGWRIFQAPFRVATPVSRAKVSMSVPEFESWWDAQEARMSQQGEQRAETEEGLEEAITQGRVDVVVEKALRSRSEDDWRAVDWLATVIPGDRSKALYGLLFVPARPTAGTLRNLAKRTEGSATKMLSNQKGKILGIFTEDTWSAFRTAVKSQEPSKELPGMSLADELLRRAVNGGKIEGSESALEGWAAGMAELGTARQADTFVDGKPVQEAPIELKEDTATAPEFVPPAKLTESIAALWGWLADHIPQGHKTLDAAEVGALLRAWVSEPDAISSLRTLARAGIENPAQIFNLWNDADTEAHFERAIVALAAKRHEQRLAFRAARDAGKQPAVTGGTGPAVGAEPGAELRGAGDTGAGRLRPDAPAAQADSGVQAPAAGPAATAPELQLKLPKLDFSKKRTSADAKAEAIAAVRAAVKAFSENAQKMGVIPGPPVDAKTVELVRTAMLKFLEYGVLKFEEMVEYMREGLGVGLTFSNAHIIEGMWRGLIKDYPDAGFSPVGSVHALMSGKKAESARPAFQTASPHLMPAVADYIAGHFPVLTQEQRAAVNLMLDAWRNQATKQGFILGDGTGFGKTMEILATASVIANTTKRPVLVVTLNKSILQGNFQKDARLLRLIGAKAKYTDMPGVVFATYNDIAGNKLGRLLQSKGFAPDAKFAAAFFDEAHTLRERVWKENATGALYRRAVSKQTADFHVFATATPMDRIEQAIYFMHSVTGMDENEIAQILGVRFVEQQSGFGGEVQIRAEPVENVTYEQVMTNLIAMRDTLIRNGQALRRYYPFFGDMKMDEINLTDADIIEYEQLAQFWADAIAQAGMGKDKKNLRSSSPKERMSGRFTLDTGRWLEPKKARHVFDRMRADLAAGKQVVIMAEGGVGPQTIEGLGGEIIPGFMQEMEILLGEAGIDYAQIYGSGTKAKEVAKFQSGEAKVGLATIKSGGTGIDLDDQVGNAPRVVYVVSLPFSGLDFDQVIGRFSRRNTMSPTQIFFVAAKLPAQLRQTLIEAGLIEGIEGHPDTVYFRSDARRISGLTNKLRLMRLMQSQAFDSDLMLGVVENPDDDVGPMDGGDPNDYGEAGFQSRPVRPDLATNPQVQRAWGKTVQALGRLGVRTQISQQIAGAAKIDFFSKTGGRATGDRLVELVMANILAPSRGDLGNAMHEFAHVLFAREDPKTQDAIHRAISRMTDSKLGIDPALNESLTLEQGTRLMEERLAESIANEGVARAEAETWAGRLWNGLRGFMLQILRSITRAMGMDNLMSDRIALEYFRQRVREELAGDAPSGLATTMWGAPADSVEMGRFLGATPRINEAGAMTFDILPPDSTESFLFNIGVAADAVRYSRPVPEQPIGVTDNPAAAVNINVAAENHRIGVANAIAAALTKVDGIVDNPRATFLRTFRLDDPEIGKALAAKRLDPKTGDPVVAGVNMNQTFDDFEGPSNAGTARRNAHVGTRRWMDAVIGKLVDAREKVKRLTRELESRRGAFIKAHQDYLNADGLTSIIAKGIRQMLVRERRLSSDLAQHASITRQLRALDSRRGAALTDAYAGAFENLYRNLDARRIFNLIEWARENDVDFGKGAASIRNRLLALQAAAASENARLLTQDTADSRALLAAIVAFAKANEAVVTQIERRRVKTAEERVRLQSALDELVRVREVTDQAIPSLRTSATLEERSRIAYLHERREWSRLERQNKAAQLTIDMGEAALPVLDQAMERLNRALNTRADSYTFGHGMKYPVPPKPDSQPKDFVERTLALDSSNKLTDRKTFLADFEAMTVWLEARKASGLTDAIYRDVEAARAELMKGGYTSDQVRKVDSWVKAMVISPITKIMEAVGTPAARMVAQMINQETVIDGQLKRRSEEFGDQNARLRDQVINAIGGNMAIDEFYTRFMEPTLSMIEKERGLLELGLSDEVIMTRLYAKVLGHFLEVPQTSDRVRGREAAFVRTMRAYVDSLAETSKWYHDFSQKHGVGVRDEALVVTNWKGENATGIRDSLPQGIQTFSRGIGRRLKTVHEALKRAHWPLARDEVRKIADIYSVAGAKGLDTALASFFTDPTVVRGFIEDMATMDSVAMFDRPIHDDGVTQGEADPILVRRAYEAASTPDGFSFAAFVEALYTLHEGTTDRGAYAQHIFGQMADTAAKVHEMMDSDPSGGGRTTLKGLVPGVMIDARQLHRWPTAWSEYLVFDRQTNFNINARVAAQIAFGREQGRLDNAFETVLSEVRAADAKLREAELLHVFPGMPRRQATRALEEALGADEFKRLKKLRELMPLIENSRDNLVGFYRSRHASLGAVHFSTQLIHTVVAGLLNNPGTALLQVSELLISPIITFGVSGQTAKQILKGWGYFGQDIIGSLGESLGLELFKGSRQAQRYTELGFGDSLSKRRFLERIDGHLSSDLAANRGRRFDAETIGPVTRTLRAIPEAMELPVRLTQVENSKFTSFTPFAPFRAAIRSTNRAHTLTLWDRTEDMVWSVMEYLEKHADVEADPAAQVTPEMLGLKGLGAESFSVLSRRLSEAYGVDVTQLAREARDRSAVQHSNEILDDQTRAVLHAMALNEISLEANLATMNPKVFSSTAARMMMPLWGWPIRRAMQVAALRLDGEGRVKAEALARMALTLAVASAAGMAFSILLDEYHEEVLRKKRNLRSVKTDLGTDPLMTMLEVSNRMGTFGVFGELANFTFNVASGEGDNRGLSLDERVVGVNALRSVFRGVSTLISQEQADYAGVIRPIVSAVGGNGAIQYWQLTNNALGLRNSESRYTARIHATNYMRVQGRNMELEVRKSQGGFSTPTPLTPEMTRMVLASYSNDTGEFYRAYGAALRIARELGKEDPVAFVRDSYRSRHPLRTVFRSITDSDYRRLLGALDPDGRRDVQEAVQRYNGFAQLLEITPYTGTTEKVTSSGSSLFKSLFDAALP